MRFAIIVAILVLILASCITTIPPDGESDDERDPPIGTTPPPSEDEADEDAAPAEEPPAEEPPAEEPPAVDPSPDDSPDDDPDEELSPGALWTPAPGTTWQWQLTGTIDTTYDVDVYDIDLFDTPQSTIDELHADGRTVICYFSAGSYEDWRPDANRFTTADYGRPLSGWDGEWWLDVRRENVRSIMLDRLDLAVEKRCDAVEPDNVDGYANNNGLGLTRADQLDYLRWLAAEAHERGLSIGLKNAVELVDDLVDDFDFAVNEECYEWNECRELVPFIEQDKAVFHVEYGSSNAFCTQTNELGFSSMRKRLDLDAWMDPCW